MLNTEAYKVMGLAAYGEPGYREEFDTLISVNEDGSYSMNQDFFGYTYSKQMWSEKMEDLLGEPRKEGEELTQRHKDIAATLQQTLEKVLLKQIDHLYELTDTETFAWQAG